jgi:hypothetical protein
MNAWRDSLPAMEINPRKVTDGGWGISVRDETMAKGTAILFAMARFPARFCHLNLSPSTITISRGKATPIAAKII